MNKRKIAIKYHKLINFFFHNKKKGKVKINNKGTILKKCRFISAGKNNVINFDEGGFFENCKFLLYGNNNTITIGSHCRGNVVEFYIEDDNGLISIGEKTSLCGKAHLAVIEGTHISIGNNCLFSSDITFRTGDSHSILDLEGKRINPSANIVIKDHVWIGHKVTVTKGVTIEENTIIGTGAIVTKSPQKGNIIVAGVPAKIIKEEVNWDHKRI